MIISILFLFIPAIDSIDATTYTPKLVKSHEGISQFSKIPTHDLNSITIEIFNIGNGTANVANYLATDLKLTEENTFSTLDLFISKSNITSTTSLPTLIPPQESVFFTWTVDTNISDEGTYTGKIFLNDSNSEIIPIDVSMTYRVSPWDMLIFSFAGLFVAVAVGSSYEFYERRYKNKEKIAAKYGIVYSTMFEVVKDILTYLDNPKQRVPNDYWKAYQEWFQKNITDIENEIRTLSLSETSKAYVRFKKLIEEFRNHTAPKSLLMLIGKRKPVPYPMYAILYPHMTDLGLIDGESINLHVNNYSLSDKIKFLDDVLADGKTLEDRVTSSSKSKPTHKILYLIATGVVSSISALLVIDSFIGSYFLNALFAGLLGFGIYRSKDLIKLFAPEEKK